MKNKVKIFVEELVDTLKSVKGARAMVLQHFAEKELYDPNFSITLDVFLDGQLPASEKRAALFPDSEYFESSRISDKDRFILKELPVRISYKDCKKVENILKAVNSDSWISMEKGTYLFHRIATGSIVWNRDDWISSIITKLDQLPESVWKQWIESCHRSIDHSLEDLGAATIKDDPLYFNLSLAGFLKFTAKLLFAVNHVFEPGPRDYTAALTLLEILPEGFKANWNSLLRNDEELPTFRKYEIAEILTQGVMSLSS